MQPKETVRLNPLKEQFTQKWKFSLPISLGSMGLDHTKQAVYGAFYVLFQ